MHDSPSSFDEKLFSEGFQMAWAQCSEGKNYSCPYEWGSKEHDLWFEGYDAGIDDYEHS